MFGLALAASTYAADVPAPPAATRAVLPKPAAAFHASFTESRTLPGFDKPLLSHGVVDFSRKDGVRWEVTAPYHYLFKMDEKGMQEVLPDGSQRSIDVEHAPWLAVIQRIFMGALAGDAILLGEYFDVDAKDTTGGRDIELAPKVGPMAKAIKHVSVTEGDAPRSIRIDEVSGGVISIRFEDVHAQTETP